MENAAGTLASIARLNAQSPNDEIYAQFFDQQSPDNLARRRQQIILNRVLHIDETDDRSRHLTLFRRQESLNLPIRRRTNQYGAPEHYVPYQAGEFELCLTDGITIENYDVVSINGIYKAHLNCTDQAYNPIHQTTYLTFTQNGQAGVGTMQFNQQTGDGFVAILGEACGWILSVDESARITETRLPQLGQIALAS